MASRPVPVWGDGRIVAWAKVSVDDYAWAKLHRWWLSDGYACRSVTRPDGSKTTILMHREVAGQDTGELSEVRHLNGDRLDNRRENLAVQEIEQDRPLGVTFDQARGKWKSQASVAGEYVYLGLFDSMEEAALARRRFDSVIRTRITADGKK